MMPSESVDGFLGSADNGGGKAEGVFSAIQNTFVSLGITNFRSELIGFGEAFGVETWVIFNWCLPLRLEYINY